MTSDSLSPSERIDRFIQQMDNREIEFVPQVTSQTRYGIETTDSWGLGLKKSKDTGTLADNLSRALSEYQLYKDSSVPVLRIRAIDNALVWINRCHSVGAVKPSDGIFGKYDDALDEIKALKDEKAKMMDELQQVSSDLIKCQGRCETLEKMSLQPYKAEMNKP